MKRQYNRKLIKFIKEYFMEAWEDDCISELIRYKKAFRLKMAIIYIVMEISVRIITR